MNRHIDIETLSRYFLNQLSSDEETAIQEHLSHCHECADRLDAMRKLREGMFGDELQEKQQTMLFRILRSGWTKAAAAIILVIGTGLFTAETIRNRNNVVEQHEIINGGKNSEEVSKIVKPCVHDLILKHIRKGALDAIEFHRKRNDKLIIVSATVDYIIKPVADALNIDFAIAAPTERINDKITGKLSGTVPYQDGKRQRIMQFLKENSLSLDDAYAYGDSVNDIEMFKLCAHRYAVNPTKELQENVYFKKLETLDWN